MGQRDASAHIAVEAHNQGKPVIDFQAVVHARQIEWVHRHDDNAKELPIEANDLAGELHGVALRVASHHRLADEKPVLLRSDLYPEVLAIAQIDRCRDWPEVALDEKAVRVDQRNL